MKTLTTDSPKSAPFSSSIPDGLSWLWWLFLLGVLAFSGVGPTCTWH